jgi:hypothetical protein
MLFVFFSSLYAYINNEYSFNLKYRLLKYAQMEIVLIEYAY